MKTDLKVRAAGTHPVFPETRNTEAFRGNEFERGQPSTLQAFVRPGGAMVGRRQ